MAQWGKPFKIEGNIIIPLYDTGLPFTVISRESKIIDIFLLALKDKKQPDTNDQLIITDLRKKYIGMTAFEMQEHIR
jgi:hypothetical protein